MGCEGQYVAEFLKYLSDFVANIRPDDPLPVRAPNYKVTESEIDGQILDIVHHYLNSRECPPYVREYVGHKVWTAIRNPEVNGDDFDHIDSGNTTNHTYDIMKLIQDVTSKANTVIQELHNTLTASEVEKLPRYHPISHFAIKNGRRKMEDRHVIIHDLSTLYGLNFKQPHAYYGVFDGHAGIDAAVYSAAHLHQYMIQNPQYETNPEAALKHAFHITDTNFIKKASKEKLKGGTTAVVALVREKRLVVAWLGDSQALLVRRRTPVRMVEPHKPELPMERERVEEMGGCVLNIQGTWRVLGQLAVSRAIGDREYKPFVSSECDIKSLEIEGDEDFLILACDGLWDTLSAEAAVNVVYAYLTRNDGDTDGVGRCLVEAARNTGSEDNITAVVVFLRPVATIMEEEAQRIAQGQVPEPVPEAVLCKNSTPSSINAIFSPPVNQFDHNEAPAYNPFDGDGPVKMDTEEAATPASLPLQSREEPMEGSEAPILSAARDSDSDEGIAAQGDNEQAFNPHEAPTPTAEEVDAALAELDSIPDEVCEAGDVEEEDEEEEEWSYYRMDLQTQPQVEDVLVSGSSAPLQESEVMDQDQDKVSLPKTEDQPSHEHHEQDEKIRMSPEADAEHLTSSPDLFHTIEHTVGLSKESNLMETSISNVGDYLDNVEAPSSPPAPGSPRSVEGFVTSVELNTPEESLGTNFPTSHTQDLNGSGVGQPSGPFSVYVSSSPEPVSLDPHQASGDLNGLPDMTNGQVENETEPAQREDFSPVEIVHAQSTVEVLASPPSEEKDVEAPSEIESNILDMETSKVPVSQTSDVTFIPEPATEPVAEVPVPVFIEEGTPVSEGEPELPHEFSPNAQTATDLLSKDLAAHETETAFRVEESPSVSPGPEKAPMSPESVSPILAPGSPCMEPEILSPGPVPVSPDVEMEELKNMESSPLPVTPVHELEAPVSPFKEVTPVSETPLVQVSTEPSLIESPSPVLDSKDAEPVSPVVESSPFPAPSSPVVEPSPPPAPSSPVVELSPPPAPASPVVEPEPVTVSPVMEPEPVSVSPVMEPEPVQEPVQTSTATEVEAYSPSIVPESVEPSVPEPITKQELKQESVETKKIEPEVPVPEEKDDIVINNGTVVIPVLPQEEVKEPEPAVKSPAKSTKAPAKAATEKSGKATPGRATPSRATPSKTTPSARTTMKPAEKKPSPLKTQKSTATTKPVTEKTTTATTRPAMSRVTPSAAKPATKPLPKTTTTKPAAAPSKSAEKKVPKPPAPTAPRANLSKPSAAANKPSTTKPSTATRTTAPAATKRPVSAPAKKIEKTDSTKVNGTTAKPAPRTTTTTRPATASTVARKPLSTSAKPVPEKETKNTTNRILSTTAKSTQRASPGTARALTTKSTATGQSTLTKTTTARVNGTSTTTTTAKARAGSVTKSSTATTKTAGIGAKKMLVTKNSSTKTKTVAAAASTKVEKSEVIVGSVSNGENKIAHEETSVEVIEKCAAEDILQCSTTEQVNNTEPVELIVNGDH